MRKSILLFLLIVVTLLTDCRSNSLETDYSFDSKSLSGENYSLYTSKGMFEEISEKRAKGVSDPFEIIDVRKTVVENKPFLNIAVRYRNRCDEQQFEIVWDGRIAESWPPGIFLFVLLDRAGCQDTGIVVNDTLSVDLYGFIGDKSIADEAVFSIWNASSDQDIQPDAPVSTENE